MVNRYIVHRNSTKADIKSVKQTDILEHSLDPYTRRLQYDAEAKRKRHERYLIARDAGKTGYKGKVARTSNPYGNFASLYYDPVKAHEYYERRKKRGLVGNKREPKTTQETNAAPQEEAQAEGTGGGGGGGGGAARDPRDREAERAAKAALQEKIQKLRQDSQFETAAQREATKMKIEALQKALKKKLKEKQKEFNKFAKSSQKTLEKDILQKQKEAEQVQKNAQKQSEKVTKQAQAAMENSIAKKNKNIETEDTKLKATRDKRVAPYREKNAELRARIDSMGKTSNPQERQRLLKELARNNAKISNQYKSYTDSLFKVKTKHTTNLRNEIDKIQTALYDVRTNISNQTSSKLTKIQTDINNLRTKNQQAIQSARQALQNATTKLRTETSTKVSKLREDLKNWTNKEKDRVGLTIAKWKGTEYKTTAEREAESKAYQNKVKKRAKEIIGSGGGRSRSSPSTSSGKIGG